MTNNICEGRPRTSSSASTGGQMGRLATIPNTAPGVLTNRAHSHSLRLAQRAAEMSRLGCGVTCAASHAKRPLSPPHRQTPISHAQAESTLH